MLTMDEFDAGTQTVLNEEQARKRAGLTSDGHNHGEDWGDAGVTAFFLFPLVRLAMLTWVLQLLRWEPRGSFGPMASSDSRIGLRVFIKNKLKGCWNWVHRLINSRGLVVKSGA